MGRRVERGHLGHVLDVEVDRVDEAPGRRQVRGGLHRRHRLGGVERVDEDEVGVVGRGRPHREVGEVAQVADAPAAGRADLVQLGHQPHGAPGRDRLGQLEALRGHDERARLLVEGRRAGSTSATRRCHPSGRSAGTSTVASPTGRPSTTRSGTHRSTWASSRRPPPSSSQCTRTPAPAGTCTATWSGRPGAGHDGGGQGAPPRGVGVLGERPLDRGLVGRVHAERGEHGLDGGRRRPSRAVRASPSTRSRPRGPGRARRAGATGRAAWAHPANTAGGPGRRSAAPARAPLRGSASPGAAARGPPAPGGRRRRRSSRPGSSRPCRREPSPPAARRSAPRPRGG